MIHCGSRFRPWTRLQNFLVRFGILTNESEPFSKAAMPGTPNTLPGHDAAIVVMIVFGCD